MQRTKSYMLPKLILLNMLALMMITFEHEVPADNNPLLSATQSGQVVAPEAAETVAAANASPPAVKVAAVDEAKVDEDKQTAMKKPAVYKKRVQQKHSANKSSGMVLKANYTANTPLGCCFRGNRI
ncbi:hypothetical protein ACIDE9_12265 [Methylophilus sp. 'Pure River']|uniref:hypothetical protein n=1 Tax=Methylophilus sp. 'Pure River' TaxID=3377117 RepID=UPI00398E7815